MDFATFEVRQKPSKREKSPKMARDFVALVGVHADDAGIVLECSIGLFLLGMVIMSLTNISMIILSCTRDDTPSNFIPPPKPPKKTL